PTSRRNRPGHASLESRRSRDRRDGSPDRARARGGPRPGGSGGRRLQLEGALGREASSRVENHGGPVPAPLPGAWSRGPMNGRSPAPFPWRLLFSELIGTAALLLGGMSLVILMFGDGSPVPRWVPSLGLRRVITGFLFGSVGGSIALSPVGKVSGGHINPAVTLGFFLAGELSPGVAVGYVIAQLPGAVLGCVPLLAWGEMGRSVAFGATVPGPGYSTATVLLGEAVTTFGLIAALCVFLAFRDLRRFTPAIVPCIYRIMA